MNIYRNRKDNQLYLLYRVSPRQVLGFWYEAVNFFTPAIVHKLGVMKHGVRYEMEDFVKVAYR